MERQTLTEKDLIGYTGLICDLEREQRIYLEMRCLIEGRAVRYDKDPVSAGIGKPTESQGIRLAQSKERIQKLAAEINRITNAVESIEDPVVKVAIKYIYFDGLSLSKTAKMLKRNRNALGKSIRACIGNKKGEE